ncbi:NADPH-dependent F420 reductase [Curtobacterium sp. USHLN213]|uniref:NADPH-dependent F420 reductase n=1 Tax=Curtobacterium sp. USHLN213 TaxID=3081255 RepID=UPI00301ABAAA
MEIAVIGTGMVGRAFATRLAGLGHDVVIGTRDVEQTLARTEPDDRGIPPLSTWFADNPDARLVAMADAGAHGELIINATLGANAIEALTLVGADNLAGKVLLDISLPLDRTEGWPPGLSIVNDDSLGELIQRTFPDTRVVKSLTTVQYEVMLNPARLPGDHLMFVAGDDADAKAAVTTLLEEFGWRPGGLFDLGGISAARAIEMYSRLQFTLAGFYPDYQFNIALVRPAADHA